jgi:antitoxin component of MazEF toxin-antitoxin module
VQDLVSANGQEVEVEIHGKKITVILPNGRRIRAELVKDTQC